MRHADAAAAEAAIAGYTVMNDVSVRDFQNRTKQFLQGKTFEHSTPLGPHLVTPDELPAGGWAIGTTLDGETVQSSSTDQLVFGPVELIVYLSQIVTLNPGDVIATGTPGGVGHARKPPRYLTDGTRGRHVRRGGRRAAQHLPRGEAVTGKSPPAVTDSLAWAADGAAHLRGLMSRLGDDAFRAPSLLPGWSRAHVLTHLARNADGMINLLLWARTGIVTPAYASAEARVADIEKGAVRSPTEIRDDVIASSDRLATVVRDLPEAAWAALVTNVQGRVIRASAVPWMRAREMWIHAVDLDAGAVVRRHAGADGRRPARGRLRGDGPQAGLPGAAARRRRPRAGTIGEGTAVVVTGPAPELAAWLLGRSKGKPLRADGARKLPALPPWL